VRPSSRRVDLRAASSDADLERILAVRAAIDPLFETTVDDLHFLRSRLRGPLHLLVTVEGDAAGFGFAGVFPEQEAEPFAFADLGVLQKFRRRGVGSTVHRALSEHVRGWARKPFSSRCASRTRKQSTTSKSAATSRSSARKHSSWT
jgi:GNAT superfamily N-acetyltransferase